MISEVDQDERAPLTRPRGKKIVEQTVSPDESEMEKLVTGVISGKPEKVKKPRKPKTQKQLDVFFEKCANARKSKLETQNKQILESAKAIVQKELQKQKQPKKQPIIIPQQQSDSSETDTEPEIIHIKKTKKKSKSRQKIVVVHSDSDTDSRDSSLTEYTPKKSFGRSHRNKKSHPPSKPEPSRNPEPAINKYSSDRINSFFTN
jgi:hypothetical protein